MHPPSRLSAVSEDLPRSRVGFHGSLVRPSASGRVARFCPSPLALSVGHLAPTRVGPVADVLCSSAISKIKPAFVVARRGTNPPDGNQLMPFAVLRKDGRLPSHARESCQDHTHILSQSDGESVGLQQQLDSLSYHFSKSMLSRKVFGVMISGQ